MRRFRALSGRIFEVPLFRLLAVNLAIGLAVAAIMVGGLLFMNPHRIRDLILADASPAASLMLLAFGFTITFGSAAMGAAIMAIGRRPHRGTGGHAAEVPVGLVPLPIRAGNDGLPSRNGSLEAVSYSDCKNGLTSLYEPRSRFRLS
jgi:hypothetical protein